MTLDLGQLQMIAGDLKLEDRVVTLDFGQLQLVAVCLPKQYAGGGRRSQTGGLEV